MSTLRLGAALSAALFALPVVGQAQGRAADYERSERFNSQVQGLVINNAQLPAWIGDSNRFWYRKSVQGGNEFVLVDAATAQKQPLFDHARLAAALSSASSASYSAVTLPFNTFRFADNESSIEFAIDSVNYRCTVREYSCENKGRDPSEQQYASQWGPLGLPPAPFQPDTPDAVAPGQRSPDDGRTGARR